MFSKIAVISLQQLVQQKFKLVYNDSTKSGLKVPLQRFPALTRLVLATTEFFPFTYRSVHAAARYTRKYFLRQ